MRNPKISTLKKPRVTSIGQVAVVHAHGPQLGAGQAAERDGDGGRGLHFARLARRAADHALRLRRALGHSDFMSGIEG